MKITGVEIKGFQSHSDSKFDLSPGLTVITGPSDSGKTALIRLIRWIAFGEPQGEAFMLTIRDTDTKDVIKQADVTEGKITLEDGTCITKTRRKGKTSYTHSAYLEAWEKAEVPQEIKDALGLRKNSYGENFETSLNFAFQLDAPFLISETGSVGAKVLGVLAGTEVIDKAISSISKSTFKLRDDKRIATKQIGELNVELLEYIEVDDLLERVERCETLITKTENDSSNLGSIITYSLTYSSRVEDLNKLEAEIGRLINVPQLIIDLQNVDSRGSKLQLLNSKHEEYEALGNRLYSLNTSLEKFRNIAEIGDLLNRSNLAQIKLEEARQLVGSLNRLISTIDATSNELSQYLNLHVSEMQVNLLESAVEKHIVHSTLNVAYRLHDDNAKAALDKLKKFGELQKAISQIDQVEKNNSMCMEFIKNRDSLYSNTAELANINNRIANVSKATELLEECKSVENQIANVDKFTAVNSDYINQVNLCNLYSNQEYNTDREIECSKIDLDKAWEEAGGKCPLCENPISTHQHSEVTQ